MKLKYLFTVNVIISAIFGLSLVFIPTKLYAMYGQQIDLAGSTTARMWGTAMIGYALLTWFFRSLPDSKAKRKVVLTLLASVYNQLIDPQPLINWSTPAIYLFLVIGYGYFHFKNSEVER